jgi:hypothetical protein
MPAWYSPRATLSIHLATPESAGSLSVEYVRDKLEYFSTMNRQMRREALVFANVVLVLNACLKGL